MDIVGVITQFLGTFTGLAHNGHVGVSSLKGLYHLAEGALSWEIERDLDVDNFLPVELFDCFLLGGVKSDQGFG